ncbi:hypothetical protein [Rhizobium lentis]|uniref:IS630 family transposase n=1 Tax=Rhizobium lentis TaxID=1138194 RepID=A0A9Q3MHE0_9HYPH|nr:hypothetical protein [Rhizobium lentis]MBX4958917.1 hypothetical protein [Rhizobium lentis]MBX4977096.1 hypothetical protein [Rhizobium lentis]MBX5007372.1 hypothetical protein [Rhizobium lentis]MBX5013822.1 hypothetical protein [Rhizobium lentis]MBX5026126.1 hypothetical protein [Rhizobium lentis]
MTQPYSEDLRERARARLSAGQTTRSIAAAVSRESLAEALTVSTQRACQIAAT